MTAGRAIHSRAIAIAVAVLAAVTGCRSQRSVAVGFWFEAVNYESSRLSHGLSADELDTVARVSRAELVDAFAGLRLTVTNQKDARYRVRVVQHLRDPRFRGDMAVAGASTAISMFGGDGAVNFSMLAAYAESYAPAEADRSAIVEAIGRGVGRTAVHELTHQLLGPAWTDGADSGTYEYGSAARKAQYYGPMHWSSAWPLLQSRFGAVAPR